MFSRFQNLFLRVALFCAVLCALGIGIARADEPSITAVLDNSETVLGQPVQLQVKITGARNAAVPSEIAVDGLDIRYSGQSQLVEGRNFQFSYSVIYTYTIMPEKTGTFRIPPQAIRVGGTTLKTPELALSVSDNGGNRSARGGRNGAAQDPADVGKNAFVELIVAKNSAYVGEMIPAEVRIGFNTRTPVESLGNGIDLTGQGFTTEKMKEPRQTIETIRGRNFQVFTFKTAIAPARSGKITIGPVQIAPIVRMPQPLNRGRGGTRDPFSLNDPFFDNFFNDPAFAPSTPREIKLESQPATLDVKALPPNAPPGFGGAVGNFAMVADAKPKTAQIGDPITVTAKISGRGNFDRVTAPDFDDERGWHKYPPSAQFKQDDDVGISGAKVFETVLSANERKTKLPVSVFSFFDPVKEQYVTLRSDAIPVRIEGGTAPTPTPASSAPAVTPANPAAASPSAAPVPAPKPADILYQLPDVGTVRTFVPLFAQPRFWFAQLVPLITLLGFAGWNLRRRRFERRDAIKARWEQEAAAAFAQLKRSDTPPREFLAAATRAVQLRAALTRGMEPNAIDAEIAANSLGLNDAERLRVGRLFAQGDELRYSGGENGAAGFSPESRREVIALVEGLGK